MKHILNILLALGLLMFASLNMADAAKKQSKKDKAQSRCDSIHNACGIRCATYIDIDNAVQNCLDQCTVKYSKCQLKAEQAAPALSQPGDSSSDGPILSPE